VATIWHKAVLFTRAWILLVAARLMCRVVPFRRIFKVAGHSAALAPPSEALSGAIDKIQKIREAVDWATTRVPRSTCLTRALAAAVLLRFAGLPYRLVIGVAKNAGGLLSAHAWIISGENIVTGNLPDLSRYVPLPIDAAIPGFDPESPNTGLRAQVKA
jgi:hypothetical protein